MFLEYACLCHNELLNYVTKSTNCHPASNDGGCRSCANCKGTDTFYVEIYGGRTPSSHYDMQTAAVSSVSAL